jgi:hypothetical protein
VTAPIRYKALVSKRHWEAALDSIMGDARRALSSMTPGENRASSF